MGRLQRNGLHFHLPVGQHTTHHPFVLLGSEGAGGIEDHSPGPGEGDGPAKQAFLEPGDVLAEGTPRGPDPAPVSPKGPFTGAGRIHEYPVE